MMRCCGADHIFGGVPLWCRCGAIDALLQGFPANLVSPCRMCPFSLIGWRGISGSNAGGASS